MAAGPSAGPQRWVRWRGGQGMDVGALHGRACCGRAETLWSGRSRLKCFHPLTAQCQHGVGGPSCCTRVSSAAVPDPPQKLVGSVCGRKKKTSKAFLIPALLLRNCWHLIICVLEPKQSELRLGLLLELVAVTPPHPRPGTPASSQGEEQSTQVSAEPHMAALVPGALLLPGLLGWDRSTLSHLCVRSICVYAAVASILRSCGRWSLSVANCLAV